MLHHAADSRNVKINLAVMKPTSDNRLSGCTHTVLMIEPVAFGYNPETAVNNYFQEKNNSDAFETQTKALSEFNAMVAKLRKNGIRVITLKDTPVPHTPDSIFPNNWVSFHPENQVVLYPMFAENRRPERRADILWELQKRLNRKFHLTDFSAYEKENLFLEGTGSIILDRKNKVAYAGISPRTDRELFLQFCKTTGFKPVCFTAWQEVEGEWMPIYHTNVMMCVAEEYAVICTDSIRDKNEKQLLTKELTDSGKEIVDISFEQMQRFAGNMLQLKNEQGEKILAMSEIAYRSLTQPQTETLEKYNRLLTFAVPTIEQNGGGSVRCMIAEIF